MKIYLDTCIYLDYLMDRKDNLRPLGEFAFQLLKRTFECEFEIIISDWVIKEINKQIDDNILFFELIDKLENLNKLIKVSKSTAVEKKAKILTEKYKTHLADALHIILAEQAEAEFLVTINVKDFHSKYKRLKIVFPENI